MGGLGLGAWLLGRRADRHERPAALYGWLEIAIVCLGSRPSRVGPRPPYLCRTAAALALDGAPSVALRFALAGAVLLIPTTLMGGTLRSSLGPSPGDRASCSAPWDCCTGSTRWARLVGTALAGFFLIEFIGVRASLWVPPAVNLALGAGAIALAAVRLSPRRLLGFLTPGASPGKTLLYVAPRRRGAARLTALREKHSSTSVNAYVDPRTIITARGFHQAISSSRRRRR